MLSNIDTTAGLINSWAGCMPGTINAGFVGDNFVGAFVVGGLGFIGLTVIRGGFTITGLTITVGEFFCTILGVFGLVILRGGTTNTSLGFTLLNVFAIFGL
jgi:hypothetical protein